MRRRFAVSAEFPHVRESGPDDGLPDGDEAESRQAEFLTLYTGAYRSIYGLLLALVAEPSVADDLMQQTSLLLWTKFPFFQADGDDPPVAFGKWARTIARNVVRNHRRFAQSRQVVFDDDLLAKIAWTRAAADEYLELRRSALKNCLKQLSAADACLLQACYGGGSDPAHLAAESGRSRDAVYKALQRIRVRLYRCVSQRLRLEERT